MTRGCRGIGAALVTLILSAHMAAAAPRAELSPGQEYSLGGDRRPGTYEYEIVSSLLPMREDGSRTAAETLHVWLRAELGPGPSGVMARYTCRRFEYTRGGAAPVELPALRDWSYVYRDAGPGEPMFNIDQAVFQGLKDAAGATLGPGEAYMVYNAFVDFHAFCDVFARPSDAGPGIQHLKRLGDRVRHAASQSRPELTLPGQVSKGSYFQNGDVVLELRALSLRDGAPCALVGYDSGASTFEMHLEPMPGIRATTNGGSRYAGDIEVDLATRWPRHVHMNEFIVSTTTVMVPGATEPQKIRSVHDRQCTIRLLNASGGPAR